MRKMTDSCLIIFIKTPVPGFAKTRLMPELSAQQSAGFYANCLMDIDQKFANIEGFDTWYFIDPEKFDLKKISFDLSHRNYCFQDGDDIGKRMFNAICKMQRSGYSKIILIGSDIPHLSLEFIQQAESFLDTSDLVLGPSSDGGYYLAAMKQCVRQVFEDIDWSTEKVLHQTLKIAEGIHLKTVLLPIEFDIDEYSELKYLFGYLKELPGNDDSFPQNTWKYLNTNIFN